MGNILAHVPGCGNDLVVISLASKYILKRMLSLVRTYVWVHAESKGQCFLSYLHLYFFRQDLTLNPELSD